MPVRTQQPRQTGSQRQLQILDADGSQESAWASSPGTAVYKLLLDGSHPLMALSPRCDVRMVTRPVGSLDDVPAGAKC